MKIKYEFVTGESVELEVPKTMEQIIIGFDKELKNSDRRETRRHNSVEDLDGKGIQLADDRIDIATLVEQQELKEALKEAMEQLLPQQRELIQQVFFNGKSIAKLARSEGVDERAIRNRLNKIYTKLKKLLQP